MSSDDESSDDVPLAELISSMRGPSPEFGGVTPKSAKKGKQKTTTKKKKKDPNEPQKPISAYALFFRDTQAAIKGQNPSASFGEVSKIVASMWDGLEPDAKNVYKKTAEAAKKEYLKALSKYQANSDSQSSEKLIPVKNSRSTSPTEKSSEDEEDGADDDEDDENEVSSKVISLADSPELTAGNDAANSKPDKEAKQSSGGIMSSDDDEPLKKPPSSLKSQGSAGAANTDTVNSEQSEKPPVNGDIADLDEIQQICLRSGCENPAIDSPEWDREYCSSECVVGHCRDVFNAWVAAKKMSPTY